MASRGAPCSGVCEVEYSLLGAMAGSLLVEWFAALPGRRESIAEKRDCFSKPCLMSYQFSTSLYHLIVSHSRKKLVEQMPCPMGLGSKNEGTKDSLLTWAVFAYPIITEAISCIFLARQKQRGSKVDQTATRCENRHQHG